MSNRYLLTGVDVDKLPKYYYRSGNGNISNKETRLKGPNISHYANYKYPWRTMLVGEQFLIVCSPDRTGRIYAAVQFWNRKFLDEGSLTTFRSSGCKQGLVITRVR